MSMETLSNSLAKAADAAGYAMALREEDLSDWTSMQPDVALRNGHVLAARSSHRFEVPFGRLADLVEQLFSLSDFSRTHTSRALLTSRT